MPSESDQRANSSFPNFEYSDVGNSCNVQIEGPYKIKQEPTHDLDCIENRLRGRFEFVELKTEQNATSSAIEMKVAKSEIDELVDCKNLHEITLKIDPNQIGIDSNVEKEEMVIKIKREPPDDIDSTQNSIQGRFELKIGQNNTLSAMKLEDEEEPVDYKNLLGTLLKTYPYQTEIDRTNNQKKRRQKDLESKTIDKSQLFHCHYCTHTTKQMGNLKAHINGVHLKKYLYRCEICSFETVYKVSFKHHESTHYKKCKYCDFIGLTREDLSAHRIENHSIYKCRFCDYLSKRKALVEKHENSIHLKKLVYCAHCDHATTLKSKLAVHLRKNHALVEAFKCKKCDFACKERRELINHVKVEHNKNYRFKCNDCGFLAKTKFKLQEHILAKHLKQRPFQCRFCEFCGCTRSRIVEHAKKKHKEVFIDRKWIIDELVFCKKLS